MPLVLVVMTHLRCIFLRVRGLHIQFIDRVVDIPVYDYELADPVSSRMYSGAIVFTAPFAELTVMLFTVPLDDCTIVATATVVPSCSSTADCLAAGVFASRCRVVVEVFLPMMLTILCGTAFCRRGEIHYQLLPVPRRCRVRRDVVWWWLYSLWCLRFCLEQCEADDWKILLISSSKGR